MMEAAPIASFIVMQPKLGFQFLVVALVIWVFLLVSSWTYQRSRSKRWDRPDCTFISIDRYFPLNRHYVRLRDVCEFGCRMIWAPNCRRSLLMEFRWSSFSLGANLASAC